MFAAMYGLDSAKKKKKKKLCMVWILRFLGKLFVKMLSLFLN